MANDPNSTNFANNGAIVMSLLSAAALVFSHFAPLQDARPSSKEPQIHEILKVQDVEARLWQDPFTAAAKAGARLKQPLECSERDLDLHCKNISKQLGLDLQAEGSDVEIIAATVSAAPYPEEEENRRRMRYALVSGLDAMNYIPKDPEHIGYATSCAESTAVKVTTGTRCDNHGNEGLPAIIPFEWFKEKFNPFKEILVLWLDEDVLFEHPLTIISNLANLIGPGARPRMHVIGPSWSDTLRAILIEACDVQPNGFCNKPNDKWKALAETRFYAYGATVNDASLFSEVRDQNGKVVGDFCDEADSTCVPQYSMVNQFLEKRGVYLLRTIATDDILAQALIKELHLRGVDPGIEVRKAHKDSDAEQEGNKSTFPGEHHIALISEWDSYYGRKFPYLVRDCAAEGYDSIVGGDHEYRPCHHHNNRRWVHIRTYLHGLDGALPQSNKAEAKKSDTTDSDENASKENDGINGGSDKDPAKSQPDSKTAERAFGQGQYDYLRRLASDLKEEDDKLKRNNEGSIKAIGVVGGDVFDKLLVLRALKPEFPEAVFFTDDYDALLALQSELRWTRNLLVASSFGPKLWRERQIDLPPFRNYVETSAFLATQLAVTDIKKHRDPASSPAHQPEAISAAPSADSQERRRAVPGTYAAAAGSGLEAPAKKKREIGKTAMREAGPKRRAAHQASAAAASVLNNAGTTGSGFQVSGRSEGTDLDVVQHTITGWLETPQIFEVERTGGMLALSEKPRTASDNNDCGKDLLKCKSVQPEDPPLYSDIDWGVKVFLGLLFTCAWIYGGVRLNAYSRILKRKHKESYDYKKGSKCTFESFAYWVFIVSCLGYALAGAAALGVWHLWPASAKLMTQNGDPMVLIQGVSVWPSIYVRAFTLVLTAWFIVDAWRKLDENLLAVSDKLKLVAPDIVIRQNYTTSYMRLKPFEKVRSFFSIRLSDKPIGRVRSESPCDIKPVWERYIIQGQPVARLWRVTFWSVVAFVFSYCLAKLLGVPALPGRGSWARDIYQTLAYTNFFGLLFLMIFVVDATLMSFNFVICLAKRNTQWPDDTKQVFIRKLGLGESAGQSALDNWIDVYFIGKRTSCIAKLIYYPFVIIALIIVCHSSVFGNFTVSQAFVVIMALAVAIVVGCAIWLNVVADQARKMAQRNLSDEMIKARGSDEEPRAKQWESLLDRVTNMREGSFLPFLQQPVVGAVLLALGSLGWTTVLEGGHLFGL